MRLTRTSGPQPLPGISYLAFTDVSGGSGTDSFTLAIGHKNVHEGREFCVIDAVIEHRPPFDPDDIVKRVAAAAFAMEDHGRGRPCLWWFVAHVSVSRYGVFYSLSLLTKSELYLHTLPLWTVGRVRLLDNQRVVDQFAQLRRKIGSGDHDADPFGNNLGNTDAAYAAVAGIPYGDAGLMPYERYGGG